MEIDNSYSEKFELIFRLIMSSLNFNDTLFFIPATFTFDHSVGQRVVLKTACWVYNEVNLKPLKIANDFAKYYYILLKEVDDQLNMSSFILQQLKDGKQWAEFKYENNKLQCEDLKENVSFELTKEDRNKWLSLNTDRIDNVTLLNNILIKDNKGPVNFNELIEKINVSAGYNLSDLPSISKEKILISNLANYCDNSYFKYIYYIPTILAKYSTKIVREYARNVDGNGVFVLCSCNSLDKVKLKLIKNTIDSCISYSSFSDLEILQEKLRISNNYSARATIMSRNMSHNLGSHVMAYLKQKMGSVTDIVRERVLADLDQVEGSLKDIIHEANIELPFLIGLGRFINYLQERQDYIATISTNYIPYNTTISFKDFIYDELKPELRYRRHHQGDDACDIIGRKPANLLLDYIAYSEGFQQSESIVLRFGCCDGCLPEQLLEGQAKIDFAKLREFEVAIPGGVVGRQGFFSIIENIIRNAAKHSSCRDDSKRLEIDINIVDVSDEESKWWQGIETFKSNNLEGETDEDLKKKYQRYSDKYYVISITNRMRNSINSLERLKRGLAKDYIDEKGMIIEEAKGLKEMRISAAWLRSFSIDLDILEKTDEPPAVVVRAVNINETNKPVADTDTECGLQYYICLPKPRKVAFIVDNDLYQQYENLNKELFPLGGYVVRSKDIKDASLDQYDIVALIIEKSHIQENIYKSLKPLLSARLIECSQKILKEIQRIACGKPISDNRYDLLKTVISKVYKIWYNSIFPSEIYKNTKLVVLDAKTEKSNLTKLKDKIVLKTTASAKWSDYNHNVVFSTHYEGMLHEQEHPTCETKKGNILLKNVSKAYFIEGITGNNSTDRLIRKNIWDEEWLYKHLVAGLTKVAIFDERIFRFIAQPNELYIGFEKLNNAIPQIFRRSDVSLGELFPILDQSFGEDSVYKLAPGTLNKLALALIAYYKDGIKEQLSAKIKEEIHSCEYDITLAQRYHEAKVWAYDIKLGNNSDDINDRWIDIIGYSLPVNVKIGDMNNAEIKKIGTIRRVAQKRFQIDFELGYKVFDFISIHQGILDKIYSYFDIRDNADLKHIFTYDFYKALSSKSDSIVFNQVDKNNGNAFYFPQLIIHSGRSRPSYSDMPQLQPFIQFAAIENAVKDCKYTLSELLYSAHYEKSDCAN